MHPAPPCAAPADRPPQPARSTDLVPVSLSVRVPDCVAPGPGAAAAS